MNTTQNPDGLDIPAGLKRTAKPVTLATSAAPVAAPKPARAAKPKTEGTPPKAKLAKASKTEAAVAEAKADTRRSIVPKRFKERYAEHDGTNGDNVATALKKATTTTNSDGRECLDEPALKAIAKANGIDYKRYEALNNGQKRMNVGNKLRGMLKGGERVTIGTKVFANAKTALAKPEAAQAQA